MSKKGQNEKAAKGRRNANNLGFNAVVSIAVLAGLVAYSLDGRIEQALTRSLFVLFICTLIGLGINLLLVLNSKAAGQERVPVESRPHTLDQASPVESSNQEA